jgi:hypothetical protein
VEGGGEGVLFFFLKLLLRRGKVKGFFKNYF